VPAAEAVRLALAGSRDRVLRRCAMQLNACLQGDTGPGEPGSPESGDPNLAKPWTALCDGDKGRCFDERAGVSDRLGRPSVPLGGSTSVATFRRLAADLPYERHQRLPVN